ncbi:MAG: hypothetical protein ACOX9B_14970 [Candidatus Xenobium sp.]|nr:hypothetical protein [Burkholderiales bacterium]
MKLPRPALVLVTFFVLTLTLNGPGGQALAEPEAPWREAAIRMSRLQTLLEYFYMETGEYPPNLKLLERFFNHGVPDQVPKVVVPVDPVTSKPFSYELSQDALHYRLAPPDPSVYGAQALTLETLDWGWMAALARQRRAEQMGMECRLKIEVLATQCEMYAKDNEGKFPSRVEDLIPKYLPRVPVCPITGQPHLLVPTSTGYFISCPNPNGHDLKKFGYASDKGMVVEPMENKPRPSRPASGSSPVPASSPAPSSSPAPAPAPSSAPGQP